MLVDVHNGEDNVNQKDYVLENEAIKKEQLFFYDFENMKIFENYYPKGNFPAIV